MKIMKHILFDLKDCPFYLLDDARFVRNSLFHASILSESQILKIDFHKFQPQGVTAFAMLAESHISIHTWPEEGVAKCDIFTCSDGDHMVYHLFVKNIWDQFFQLN